MEMRPDFSGGRIRRYVEVEYRTETKRFQGMMRSGGTFRESFKSALQPMNERQVLPEILDSLPPEDPEAIRSRRDLRLVNSFMGNYRWIARTLRRGRARDQAPREWVEIGAGDGHLAHLFKGGRKPGLTVRGVDLAPRPDTWPDDWKWSQGDLFEELIETEQDPEDLGLIANLFLHHFEAEALAKLGGIINRRCRFLVISEPARHRFFSLMGYSFHPFVNHVTRHDMQVSIGAGFRNGELPRALRLESDWIIRESTTLLGAYRLEAWRPSATSRS